MPGAPSPHDTLYLAVKRGSAYAYTGRVFPQTVISCLLLIGLAYVACAIPIMKAALAQPMHTLREE